MLFSMIKVMLKSWRILIWIENGLTKSSVTNLKRANKRVLKSFDYI